MPKNMEAEDIQFVDSITKCGPVGIYKKPWEDQTNTWHETTVVLKVHYITSWLKYPIWIWIILMTTQSTWEHKIWQDKLNIYFLESLKRHDIERSNTKLRFYQCCR